MSVYDVVIVGGGIVGAAAALNLAKNTNLKIAILDTKKIISTWQSEKYSHRVSAISLASQRIFEAISVWDAIQSKRVSSYTHIHVWDEKSKSEIHFDCQDVGEKKLGYIIEDNAIHSSLSDALLKNNINIIAPIKLTALHEKENQIELISDDLILQTKLLIAADGANSWVREQAGILLKAHSYEQTATVATVRTELPHNATARQCFLATGPLAFLPLLDEHTCSIVWSTTSEHVAGLLLLDDHAFCAALGDAFSYQLGEIISAEPRYSFPLHMRHAKNYIKSRIALIGDAAHTLHPLAGQGVNLGLLDAACLVDTIKEAIMKQRDFASFSTLRRYERARKGNNLAMLAMVELFASQNQCLKSVRNTGLSIVNRMSVLKNNLTRYALGKHTTLL